MDKRRKHPDVAIGDKFGKLTVVEFSHVGNHFNKYWKCICACGKEKTVRQNNMQRGKSISCGCILSLVKSKHGAAVSGKMTPEYRIWQAIIDRCTNPNNPQFKDYGGRGITICIEWLHDFSAFILSVGLRPSPELTIDRIDNNKGYEPGNIRWATRKQQMRNSRSAKYFEFNGESHCIAGWAEICGVAAETISRPLRKGKDIRYVVSRYLK